MRQLHMLVTVTLLPTSRDWSALRLASEIASNLQYEGFPAQVRLLRQGEVHEGQNRPERQGKPARKARRR